jgi:hypothetical protein
MRDLSGGRGARTAFLFALLLKQTTFQCARLLDAFADAAETLRSSDTAGTYSKYAVNSAAAR